MSKHPIFNFDKSDSETFYKIDDYHSSESD